MLILQSPVQLRRFFLGIFPLGRGIYPKIIGRYLDIRLRSIPTVGATRSKGSSTTELALHLIYSIIHLRSALSPPSLMDSSTACGSAATGHTVGGRSVNFSGCQGHPIKKPSFARDDRLARDGARLMTGPFCPPAQLLHAAPAAASASIVAAVGRPAAPPPAATPLWPPLPLLISPTAISTMTAMTVASVRLWQGTRARPPSSASRGISCASCRIN